MKIRYEEKAMAIYIKVNDIERGRDGYCEELIEDEVIIDRTKDGVITGIEILHIESIEDYNGNKYGLVEPI